MADTRTRAAIASAAAVLAIGLLSGGCGSGGGGSGGERARPEPSAPLATGTAPYPTPSAPRTDAFSPKEPIGPTRTDTPRGSAVRPQEVDGTDADAVGQSATGVRWRERAGHRAGTTVPLKKTEDAAKLPDTGTEARRQWTVTATPKGREGWKGAPAVSSVYVHLGRTTAGKPWRVAEVTVR